MISSVGFIGLGDMGAKQAWEIAKLPVSLTVFDTRREAMAPFEGRALLAGDIAEVGAASELVGLCVQDDAQVIECVEALLPAMRSGSVILVHATVRPATVIALAERAGALGIALCDAPVTRTRPSQDGPFVFCPMGGEEDIKTRVQPVLDAFATDTMLVGPVGSAMALKICNNLISWCEIVVGLEALSLAEAAGLKAEALLELTSANGLLTPPMKIFADFKCRPHDAESWRQRILSAGGQAFKDLSLAGELAGLSGIGVPLATYARDLVRDAIGEIAPARS